MFAKYEKGAYQFLAAYRFLSYALAVMFTQIRPTPVLAAPLSDQQIIIILAGLGVYSMLKVFSPVSWREKSVMTYVILCGDFLLSMMLVVTTGGLNSAFLLYSLAPIMTAALLFEEMIALSLAVIASLSLSISHLALSRVMERLGLITEGTNLTLLIVYTLFCFVSATVPYRINLNIRRRIEREAIMDERRRIARELHDGVAQSLGYLNTKIKQVSDFISSQNPDRALTELNEIRKVVRDTYDDIREAIDQLSIEMRNLPIVPALSLYIREFGDNTSLKVHFDHARPFPELSPVAELQLLRIAQEALTNIRRHARATEVEVRLETNKSTIKMVVKDNGLGFILDDLGKSLPGYHGLNIIKERAETLGGSLSISTAPGKGTSLTVNLPLDRVRL